MDLQARRDELDIESRRRVVQALAERIGVGPAVKGGGLLLAGEGEGNAPAATVLTVTRTLEQPFQRARCVKPLQAKRHVFHSRAQLAATVPPTPTS